MLSLSFRASSRFKRRSRKPHFLFLVIGIMTRFYTQRDTQTNKQLNQAMQLTRVKVETASYKPELLGCYCVWTPSLPCNRSIAPHFNLIGQECLYVNVFVEIWRLICSSWSKAIHMWEVDLGIYNPAVWQWTCFINIITILKTI